ncbi:MAG TPA: T9SS type A sorting domain-containing protein [Gemmatimonadales bacterium]|nr:T9SS type A sorting domain-containing protein [Gemmatimonadales bacterium]
MHSISGKRGALLTCLAALALTAFAPSETGTRPEPGKKRGFRLFAGAGGSLQINRVFCGLTSFGTICNDSTGSSTVQGGFWPRGTANAYVFNSGLQIAGIIGPDGGDWAGDTTGAFIFNARGGGDGQEVEPIYNSINPDDAANWPDAAKVPTELLPENNLFNPLLRGRVAASQGDIWYIAWDGNPAQVASRPHPLGIAIETRGMGWNFPPGNEDILYFTFTFYNVTASDPAAYANVRPEIRDILAEAGANFQSLNEAAFDVNLPDGGYTLTNLFASFGADMDVADFSVNYSSVNLPFALGYTYEHTFGQEPGWTFDPAVFGAPFFPGTGFAGVKYLRSPTGAGEIQLFSNTLNQATGFFDPQNATQLYRYLSGTVSTAAGDQACNFGPPATTHVCFINPTAADSRFFQSSTPLTLGPGQFGSIVVAYIFAAPVAVPGFEPPVSDQPPGDPRILTDAAGLEGGDVNVVDRLTGFLSYTDDPPIGNSDGVPQQGEFTVVSGSLLGKSLVAQQVFNNGFLLPFAPESPPFFLVPGNGAVTVLWQPSVSETSGDPFFAVANSPTATDPITGEVTPSILYDPNYRQFDVEGYRIYRGRTDSPTELQLLAQFDYAGTTIRDFAGQINPVPGCAPELGIDVTTTDPVTGEVTFACPVDFDTVVAGQARTVFFEYPLVGEIVQTTVAPGGSPARIALANGTAFVTASDTAVTGSASGENAPLADTGVPFSFVDRTVRNDFRYFYSVVAFDVNSFQSGPSSLESARTTRSVTPVATASNVNVATEVQTELLGSDGAPIPSPGTFTIDAATGRFNGLPPANLQLEGVIPPAIVALAPVISGSNALTGVIDSVRHRADGEAYPLDNITAFPCGALANGNGFCQEYFVTFTNAIGGPLQTRTVAYLPILTATFGDELAVTTETPPAPVPLSAEARQQFAIPESVNPPSLSLGITVPQHGKLSSGENFNGRRELGAVNAGGSRWFTGDNETLDHPTYGIRVGNLPGVDTIFAPLSHIDADPVTPNPEAVVQPLANAVCMQTYNYVLSGFGRQADVELIWGPGGTIASVQDLTHNVPIPFKPIPQSSWGFVTDNNGNGNVDWYDMRNVEGVSQYEAHVGFCAPLTQPAPGAGALLTNTAVVTPVAVGSSTPPATPATTGQGFGLYVAGHFHIFQLTGGVLPAAGTRWVLRSYSGVVDAATGRETTAPSGYTFEPNAGNPAIAGLQFRVSVPEATAVRAATEDDLSLVHTVPDPYYVTNEFEQTTDNKIIKFVNLPAQAIIRIYSSSGVLVQLLEHRTSTLGGSIDWNVRNRNNQVVASGVYFYHVESGDARRVGRFTVVNFAQ